MAIEVLAKQWQTHKQGVCWHEDALLSLVLPAIIKSATWFPSML